MGRILVVDDERAIRELLRCVLELEGHEVVVASNGLEALAFLAEARLPWVVLMDVMMPRLGGIEVCEALRETDALASGHLIALMTAGLLEECDCPAPARALIRKPFDVDRIVSVVGGLLAEMKPCAAAPIASAAPELSLAAGV